VDKRSWLANGNHAGFKNMYKI